MLKKKILYQPINQSQLHFNAKGGFMKSSIILSLGIALLCTFAGCDLFNPADPDDQFTAQDGNAETASLELSDMGLEL